MVMAQIYTKCGKYDKAMGLIDYLLSLETTFTANDIKMDPFLKPLQDSPEFRALMEKYALPADL